MMRLIINGERALAYVVKVDEIKPIEGYNRVEYARTNGWWVVVSKSYNLEPGDKCVYFEIDSRVPDSDPRFSFLASKHFKIKTQKMCKVVSQGLLIPLSSFPELGDAPENTDVTKKLGVVYSVAEDNERKRNVDPKSKYKSMSSRHPKIFGSIPAKWLMKKNWGRSIMFFFFGKKKDKPLDFPSFIKKTDEERIENQPWRVGDDKEYVITEKLDGTSCTYVLKRSGTKKFDFIVCSRNRRLPPPSKSESASDIYWHMAEKYDIEKHLHEYLDANEHTEWVCLQGEGVGSVQGNPLKLEDDDLYIFNFITSLSGRFNSYIGKHIINEWGMKWVPILGVGKTQPTMEETKAFADGKSLVNPNVLREGVVYRSLDGSDSFKNVSRKYLLKH